MSAHDEYCLAQVRQGDRDRYLAALDEGGILAMSGFYDFDEAKVTAHYLATGLKRVARKDKDSWVMLAFEKQITPR